jgi:hypothetical protein
MIHFKTGRTAGFPLMKPQAFLQQLNLKFFNQSRPARHIKLLKTESVLKKNRIKAKTRKTSPARI